jgi:hypothetical protein
MEEKKTDGQTLKDECKKLKQEPPQGFGKGVNDYLNHYITVSDAKAVAFLALNFVVIQLLIKNDFCETWTIYCHWIALGFLTASVLTAALVLLPRLPRSSKGLIFWEDILERKTPEHYENELTGMQVEREYAHQNFYVSKILHKKMRLAQWTIGLFLVGTVLTIYCMA